MLETIERMAARHDQARCRRSRTPARPRDVEGRNIYLSRPSTWRRTRAASSARACGWSAAAAGRRPSTSGRSSMRCGRWRPAGSARRASARGTGDAAGARSSRRSRARDKSRLANALADGRFVVTVELSPPRGPRRPRRSSNGATARRSTASTRSASRTARERGARMSALSLRRSRCEQQAGIETVLHYACRDRNLLGMQSDLLGAHAMGVRNLLMVTGDPRTSRRLSRRDGGVRRGLDRPDQRGGALESRASTSAASRLDGRRRFTSACRVNPSALEPRRRGAALRVQGRGRSRVRRDAAGVRRRRASTVSSARRTRARAAHRRRFGRSRACGTPSISPTRCRTCACPRR